jgi:hypothetical protein
MQRATPESEGLASGARQHCHLPRRAISPWMQNAPCWQVWPPRAFCQGDCYRCLLLHSYGAQRGSLSCLQDQAAGGEHADTALL